MLPDQIIETSALRPTARSIQSGCETVIPWNRLRIENCRYLASIGFWEIAEVDEARAAAARARSRRDEEEEQAAADRRDEHDPVARSRSRRTTARATRAAVARSCPTRPAGRSASRTAARSTSAPPRRRPATRSSRGRGHVALDPEQQRDQEQRRDVEHVPLLDAQRLLGREGGDLEHDPERERDARRRGTPARCADGRASSAVRTTSATNGTTPSDRIELLPVVDQPVEDAAGRVAGVAGDLVRAEDAEHRRAARDLDEDEEQRRRGDADEEPAELAQCAAAGDEERRGRDRREKARPPARG